MKRFLLRLTIFVLLTGLIAWLGEYLTSQALRSSRQLEYGTWNELLNGRINADLVVHGSSKAAVQVNPKIIEEELSLSAYNLGLDAYAFNMQLCRHRLLLERNKKPGFVLHVLDWGMFEEDNLLYFKNQFLPYLNEPGIYNCVQHRKGLSRLDRVIPFYKYIGQHGVLKHAAKVALFPGRNIPDRYHGFSPQNLEWNDDLKNAWKDFPKGRAYEVDQYTLNLFIEYINDSKAKGIKIILILPPEYEEGHAFVVNRRQLMEQMTEIAADNNVVLINFKNHPMTHDRGLFYNSNHLNAHGADLFTRILCDSLKRHL